MQPKHLTDLPLYKKTAQPTPPKLSDEIGFGLELFFLLAALLLFFQGMTPVWEEYTGQVALNFLAIIVEALPFMLIGSLVGGIIEVFVPVERIDSLFGSHRQRAVFIGGGLGLFFPVCDCAIIPVVRRLLGKGMGFGAAIAFLLAGPLVNPIVATSTAIAYSFNWTVVFTRLLLGYFIAVGVGLLMGRYFGRSNGLVEQLRKKADENCGCCSSVMPLSRLQKLKHCIEHGCDDFFEVGKYLVIGALIAAIMRSSISMQTFTDLMNAPWLAIILMMLLALLLNLCSEADAFIAASFRDLLPLSSQISFMVLGPMLDMKLILMYFSVFSKKVIFSLIVLVFSAVFICSLLLEKLLPFLTVTMAGG